MRITLEGLRLARANLGGIARQARLRRAAVRYAEHGWDVIPGACLQGARYYCGPGCTAVACHPAFLHGEALLHPARSSHDRHTVAAWWRERPHAVLLSTGSRLDVLEVPAHLGAGMADRPVRGPVAVTATGRYMLLVRPGAVLCEEFAALPDVVLHEQGSWIPAPPTAAPEGRVHWVVSPEEVDWQLPDAAPMQQDMVRALPRSGTTPSARPSLKPAA